MINKTNLLKALPHVVAIIVFLVIANTFFNLLGSEYVLKQHDVQNVMGMSKEIVDYRYLNGEEALWTDNMFGGMPAYQINISYPSNWLRKLDDVLKFFMSPTQGSLYMLMLGFYILMLCLRVNPWLGIVAAISFGLSSFNLIYLASGHTSKINALGYMAPALGGLILAYRGKWLVGSAVFALFFGLHLMSNHLQMTYYFAFAVGLVAISEVIRLAVSGQWMISLKTSLALAVAGVLALLPNVGNMLTTYEYSKLTTRGKTELTIAPPGQDETMKPTDGLRDEYILEYNMSAGELWAVAIPNAKGGSSSVAIADNKDALSQVPKQLRENVGMFGQYWGGQGSSAGAFYFGAAMLFLFVLALIFIKDTLKWPFLVLTILVIFLSRNDMNALNDFFIHKFPMYNKFRDTKMIHVLLQIMAPALGILFVDQMIKSGVGAQVKKYIWGGCAALIAVMLLLMVNPQMTGPMLSNNDIEYLDQMRAQYKSNPETIKLLDQMEDEIIHVREYIFTADAQRSFFLILLAAGMVFAMTLNKLKWYVFAGLFGVISIVDMWSVSARYVNDEKRKNPSTGKMEYRNYVRVDERVFPFTPDVCDDYILQREKGKVQNYDEQVSKLEQNMQTYRGNKNVKNKELFHMAAEYGALNLNTDYRVLLASRGVFAEASIPYFHKSLGGYHAAKLKRYQEMIDFHLSEELGRITQSFQSRNPAVIDSVLSTCDVINMLNTRYIKYSGEAPPILNDSNAFGNAWFAKSVKWAASADEEMTLVGEENLRDVTIVHQEFKSLVKDPVASDTTASITLKQYATKRLTYQSHNSSDALAVFSEIYYPAGWICRIDGAEVPTLRANYILRSVMIPAGDHEIEWSFEPASYKKGSTINLAGSALLFLFVLGILGSSVYRSVKGTSHES
ncbi:MAG: hypothetical protein K1X54_00460 [Flavobacteriales bacterium]|nr:hypothetical protein [Flavobacteriales bacterium]